MTVLVLLSAICAAGAAVRAKVDVSPVEKVLTLMQDLKSQVESEGAAEAETYDKLACFCKDKQLEKEANIKSGEDDQQQQEATLQQQTAEKNMLASDIADLNGVVANSDSVLKGLETKRNDEYTEYLVEHKDVGDSVAGVKAAIVMVEKGMGLIQLANITKTQKVAAMVQSKLKAKGDGGESQGVMEVLEMLEDDWSKKLLKIENEETARVTAYDSAVAAQHTLVDESKSAIDTKTDFMADCDATIADFTGRLVETKALKSDDGTYLKDLTAQCARKATEWDQRSKMRADELAALGKAIGIISGDVATAATDSGAGGRSAVKPVESLVQARKVDDSDDYHDIVFLQKGVQKGSEKGAQKDSTQSADRLKAITVINKASKSLKSPELSLLAMSLAADPFAKVKTLIQQLIERLMTESANEATHKGWCDTEVATATHHRDYRFSDTKNLGASVMVLESRKSALENEIVKLTDEISELNTAYTERTRIREGEKAENKQTLESAQEGLKALTQAIEVLSAFYRKAGRAEVFFQEKAPVTSSPVAADMQGSEYSGGAYKGNQAGASGIMGMLETIKSDFQRTIDTTSSSEKQSSEDYAQFNEETKASISGKETGLKNANAELKITSGDMVRALNDLGDNQKLLDQSLEALEVLRSACIDTGMTYEEKVAKREAEIEALKSALEIFSEADGLSPGFLQK
jgi:hypothetical protein